MEINALKFAYEQTMRSVAYAIGILFGLYFPFLLWGSARLIPALLLLGIYFGYTQKSRSKPWPLRQMWWAFWLILLFVRVDLSFINKPGHPRFVRYAVGLPGPQTMREWKKGNVVLHGCIATGLEPLYVWVW